MKTIVHFIPLIVLFFVSCSRPKGYYGSKNFDPVMRKIQPADVILPDGYKIQPVATGLNFPTSVTFDEQGRLYVIEAGYSYGEVFTECRLLRVEPDGRSTLIAKGQKNGPWTCVDYHEGFFYVAEGGTMQGGKILKISLSGEITPLVENLPSYGDHHTNGVIVGNDGYIYFGQGTATNSAVVGTDNWDFGWLQRKKEFHDIPCEDITLAGENYETENILSEDREKIKTGAFVPFGTKTTKGQVIKGSLPCNGAVMQIPLNGGSLELVAWGFRNPYALGFSASGELFVCENGYDVRGSRPVYGTGDLLWKVGKTKWFGWPDFSGNDSLWGKDYQSLYTQTKPVLMKHPGVPPKPLAEFGVHSSSNGFDFSRSNTFGFTGHIFVAQFGDMAPGVGDVIGRVGFKVVSVDPQTGVISDFAVNKGKLNGPASHNEGGGLERPVSVAFSPDGSELYIVDFGVLDMTKKGPAPKQMTGMIWKVSREPVYGK